MAHRRKPLGVAVALMTGVPVRVGAQVGRRLLAVPGARSVATPVRRAGAVRAVHEAARRASAASSEALWTPSTKETQAAGHGAGAELHREHGPERLRIAQEKVNVLR